MWLNQRSVLYQTVIMIQFIMWPQYELYWLICQKREAKHFSDILLEEYNFMGKIWYEIWSLKYNPAIKCQKQSITDQEKCKWQNQRQNPCWSNLLIPKMHYPCGNLFQPTRVYSQIMEFFQPRRPCITKSISSDVSTLGRNVGMCISCQKLRAWMVTHNQNSE